MNDAERLVWWRIRKKRLGHRFRRQHVIGRYIVDFVCLERRLVVEIDGSQHLDSPRDRMRDGFLARRGFRVLRIWSWDVIRDLDIAVHQIATALEEGPDHTSM